MLRIENIIKPYSSTSFDSRVPEACLEKSLSVLSRENCIILGNISNFIISTSEVTLKNNIFIDVCII